MKYKQYEAVRIVGLRSATTQLDDEFNLRPPKVGDVAYIIEVYADPEGYELECSDANGITQWLMSFRPDEIELELMR